MATPTTAQIEQLKRSAKKLARSSSISHAAALDRLAAENGFKNWSLLAKRANAVSMPAQAAPLHPGATAQPTLPPSTAPARTWNRKYLHGDQDELNLETYYCARCDIFGSADHLFSGHTRAETLDRCLHALDRWAKRPTSVTATRPADAFNVLEQPAREAAAAREAARGPFHRWLEKHKGKDTLVGDFATDALRDASFPVGATTQEEIERYLQRIFAPSDFQLALDDAWKKFKAAEKRKQKRLSKDA